MNGVVVEMNGQILMSATPVVRVLLIEDNPADAAVMREALREFDSHSLPVQRTALEWVARLAAGLDVVAAGGADVVLLDLSLPDCQPVESFRRLIGCGPDVPIIVLAGPADTAAAVELVRQGAQESLVKGKITSDVLGRAIRSAVEQRDAEGEHDRTSNQLRLLAESTSDLLLVYDSDRRLQFVNPAAERAIGMALSELQVQPFGEFLHADDRKCVQEMWERAFADPAYQSAPARIAGQSGEVKWVNMSLWQLTDDQGKPAGVACRAVDISEHKRAEETLAAGGAQYRLLADQSVDLISLCKVDGTYLYVSPACRRLLGYDPLEMTGHCAFDFIHLDDVESFEAAHDAALLGSGVQSVAYRGLHKDGSSSWLESQMHLVTDSEARGGKQVQATTHDISARHRADKLLRALNHAVAAMAGVVTVDEVFGAVATEFKAMGYSCLLFSVSQDRTRLLVKFMSFNTESIRGIERANGVDQSAFSLPIDSSDAFRSVVREGKTVFMACGVDIMEHELEIRANDVSSRPGAATGPKSIAAPLSGNGDVGGVFCVQSPDVAEDDVAAVTAFAHQLSAAWYKAKSAQEMKVSLQESEQAATALKEALDMQERANGGLITTIAMTVEARDPFAAGHQKRVSDLCVAVAKEMQLPADRMDATRTAALLHDVGKIGVPAELLSKPGRLTNLEFNLIMTHPRAGYDLLKTIDFPWPVAKIVLQHHERLDGSGYPEGLKGQDIVLEARILAVADVVEAMVSPRSYRSALGLERAMAEISSRSGIQFDPDVVDACLRVLAQGYVI